MSKQSNATGNLCFSLLTSLHHTLRLTCLRFPCIFLRPSARVHVLEEFWLCTRTYQACRKTCKAVVTREQEKPRWAVKLCKCCVETIEHSLSRSLQPASVPKLHENVATIRHCLGYGNTVMVILVSTLQRRCKVYSIAQPNDLLVRR